jgi:hypothetical protein
MNEVIAVAGEICASNAQMETIGRFGSGRMAHGGHAIVDGTNLFGDDAAGPLRSRHAIFVTQNSGCSGRGRAGNCACDKASLACAVMLHLRACYVSKAAILTIPALPVPVENRSPA